MKFLSIVTKFFDTATQIKPFVSKHQERIKGLHQLLGLLLQLVDDNPNNDTLELG